MQIGSVWVSGFFRPELAKSKKTLAENSEVTFIFPKHLLPDQCCWNAIFCLHRQESATSCVSVCVCACVRVCESICRCTDATTVTAVLWFLSRTETQVLEIPVSFRIVSNPNVSDSGCSHKCYNDVGPFRNLLVLTAILEWWIETNPFRNYKLFWNRTLHLKFWNAEPAETIWMCYLAQHSQVAQPSHLTWYADARHISYVYLNMQILLDYEEVKIHN